MSVRIDPRARVGLALAIVAAIAGVAWLAGGPARGDTDAPPPDRVWTSSVECRDCHQDVWSEWLGSQHQIAYLNPEVRALSDDFRNKACQACHLPRPVAVTGYERRTLHRTTLPDEGVSCLTCHLGADGAILARHDRPDAPCAPRADAEFAGVPLCASCHNQHGTTDQWRATAFAAEGRDCNDCHMPATGRPGGRSHVFPGGHARAMLLAAIAVAAGVEGGALVVTVENRGAGHNFPTEERSRAADVVVRFDDGPWERAHRFRLPYRNEPLPDTTLPHGEVQRVSVSIPAGARRATVRVWYRRTPFVGDDDPRSTLLHEGEVDLEAGPALAALPAAAGVEMPPRVDPELRSPRLSAPAGPAWSGPPLPAPELRPCVAELRALAGPAPELDDNTRSLARTALDPTSPSRLAHRARGALQDDPRASLAFAAVLDDQEPELRAAAADELGRRGDVAALPALLLRLKNEDVEAAPRVRVRIARAMADLGNDAALPELVAAMGDASIADEAGRDAIAICNERDVEISDAPTWTELEDALGALHRAWRDRGHVGETAPPPDTAITAAIARHLANLEEFQLRLVDEARFVVARLGTRAVPLLRDALHAAEPYVRAHSLEILRDLGPAGRTLGPDALPLLGDDLTSAYAAEALGRIAYAGALPHLVARLDHPDLELRAKCAEALASIADDAALVRLRALFEDESQPLDARVHAAYALAVHEPDGAALRWLRQLRDEGGYHAPTLEELIGRTR